MKSGQMPCQGLPGRRVGEKAEGLSRESQPSERVPGVENPCRPETGPGCCLRMVSCIHGLIFQTARMALAKVLCIASAANPEKRLPRFSRRRAFSTRDPHGIGQYNTPKLWHARRIHRLWTKVRTDGDIDSGRDLEEDAAA